MQIDQIETLFKQLHLMKMLTRAFARTYIAYQHYLIRSCVINISGWRGLSEVIYSTENRDITVRHRKGP